MCTITMLPGSTGSLLLAGNRDERRSRKRAIPPGAPKTLEGSRGELRAIFPVDADALGTWIGVNEAGVAMTLLNNYQRAAIHDPALPTTSRGQLVLACLAEPSLDDVDGVLRQWRGDGDLAHVRPFVLLVGQARHNTALCVEWTGEELRCDEEALPLIQVSSGARLEEARAHRRETLRELLEVGRWHDHWERPSEALIELFSRADPEPSTVTVRMERGGARTVSHTQILIADGDISMLYLDGPPGTAEATRHEAFLKLR